MKLSELVNYYNRLCELSTKNSQHSADVDIEYIIQLTQSTELKNAKIEVMSAFDKFELEFDQLKAKIYDQIREQEKPYLQDSYKFYEKDRGFRYEWLQKPHPSNDILVQEEQLKLHVEQLLTRRLPLAEGSKEIIEARLARYSGWHNTGMILHPGPIPEWASQMVSLDPIYYVDENYELLRPAMAQFPKEYQNRIRAYTIREDRDEEILWQLPNNQFGVVMAWNFFNHRPFEVIRRYLTEIYNKMRPGSILMMTYNDCDRWPGVAAVENCAALYTPGSLILNYANSLGFEMVFSYHDGGHWTWVEFQKPGNRPSLRGAQPLAQILPKPIA